jgi:hypothetical protein
MNGNLNFFIRVSIVLNQFESDFSFRSIIFEVSASFHPILSETVFRKWRDSAEKTTRMEAG